MRSILLASILIIVAGLCLGATPKANSCVGSFDSANPLVEYRQLMKFLHGEPIVSRSGCCSWHDGECGCVGGRVECCDGTTSPSCTC